MTTDKQTTGPVTAFKGFDKNLACRGYQYSIGETYEHAGRVVRCASGGFHSCEYPLDVFNYYPPADSRYAVVLAGGEIDRKEGGDTKLASGKITIEAELRMPQLISKAIDWIMARVDKASGVYLEQNRSHASNTGDYSAASNTGYGSAASNTGDYSAASNTGDYSAASNTGYGSAASNTGARSAASNTGARSAASVEGKHSVALAAGAQSRAKACKGSAIVLVYRDLETTEESEYGRIVHIRAAVAGRDGVKPDTWYMLDEAGELVEVDEPSGA
ncbi:hypothetical protein CAL26_09845 [Bordetella genomosp. 9]|uniref:DUF7666 domain-containing protein n=1 Tax=Bordetella genomosp. 9 TaxID=1416803 RepID=A0A261RFC3_9BORD|nr:hypothetical protein [Bordetella genomosp. 9]OZI23724.1 hypothetical protein CAL26_09845 [Bordetella genomosp. 9]